MGGMSGGGQGNMISQISASIGSTAGYFIARKKGAQASRDLQTWQERANALYTDLYDETAADYKPYQEGGATAYQSLLRTYGLGEGQDGAPDYSAFQNSPDYQFNLQQGQNALDRSAASRGRLFSGAQVKGSQAYGQGMASNQLGTYRQGLGNLADMGIGATGAMAGVRQNYGNQLGQGYTNIGDIRAAEHLGTAQAHTNWNQQHQDIWGVGGGGGGQQQQQQPTGYGRSWTGQQPSNASAGGWNGYNQLNAGGNFAVGG